MLRHLLLKLLLNPFFQALVLALLVVLLVPLGIQKYKASLVEYQKVEKTAQYYYADLDHDGWSERLLTGQNTSGNSYIVIHDSVGDIDQWNFRGTYPPTGSRFMTGDFDHINQDEIYLFTIVHDSIILNALKFTSKPSFFLKDKFIARIGMNSLAPDPGVIPGKVTDLDGDGFGELVFAVNTGLSKQPRNVYSYNIRQDSLSVSPQSGSFITQISLSDLDNDSKDEIMVDTYASDNIKDSTLPYRDQSCWLMVLDDDLEFLFPPLEFPGKIASLTSGTVINQLQRTLLISLYNYSGNQNIDDQIILTDLKGRRLKEKIFHSPETMERLNLFPTRINSKYDLLTVKGYAGIVRIDTALEFHPYRACQISSRQPYCIDLYQDGNSEALIANAPMDRYLLFDEDLRHPVELNIPMPAHKLVSSVVRRGDNPPRLSIQSNDELYLYNYGLDPVYSWRLAIYLGIYVSILAFILLIRLLQHIQLRRRYETEKKLTAFQLSSIKSQMDPHFIYNVINTIGSSIYKENRDEAYKSVVNFSTMVRTLLASSDQLSRPLSEELEFTRSFLELQKARFRDKFDYSIELSSDCDEDIEIPKMIIQTHAENAIKHGLAPKESPGRLHIKIFPEKNYLMIEIEDNGVGRGFASQHGTASTGKGLRIIEQFFKMYNRYNKPPIHQEIIDLYDAQDNPAGTKVVISVPLNYNRNVTTG